VVSCGRRGSLECTFNCSWNRGQAEGGIENSEGKRKGGGKVLEDEEKRNATRGGNKKGQKRMKMLNQACGKRGGGDNS
jgi:hypothetical protein